ncbi:MAG: EAL domain-containing protein [Betaproteobacteria bacterium]|jgi:EAL domain-containing protein (putative c-di-GMP-specific phosphodiesterase class I)/CheY-like chemotaxis protein
MSRVLVVDDEPQVLAGIRRAIGRRFEIDAVASAQDAIERIKGGERYAAILSDLAMADIDGLLFLEKARELVPSTPRIMLTGHADRTALLDAINRAGVAGFLQKPVTPTALITALERAISDSPGARSLPSANLNSRQAWIARELATVSFQHHFDVLLQPRICTQRGTLVAAEALLRWTHPQQGPISPAEFIPIAEQIGQINRITAWVLRATAGSWQRLKSAGLDIPISVNLSLSTIRSAGLFEIVCETLTCHGMPASRLEVEITESHRLESSEAVQCTLASLKALGVRTALDDFGTGYASYDTLRALDIDMLKIDRSFVAGLYRDHKNFEIVRSITDLARSLDLTVIAEGVEQPDQAMLLSELGVQQLQGYLFAAALPIDQLRSRELAERIDAATAAWRPSSAPRTI